MVKIFTAGLLMETTDLSPIATTEKEWLIERPEDQGACSRFREMLLLFREKAEAKGWEVAEGLCASSYPPGGRTVKSVYENMRDMILDDLRQAMPVDGVLLQLHGAAMAYGYDDCEGDLLEHIRGITGPDIPIGAELDPHCHMTEKMISNTTAMILYKTFAHTDIKERAVELFTLIADTIEGKVNPVMAVFDCRMMDLFDEEKEPMKSFLESVYLKEEENNILSISPVHGFPLADVVDMGSKMLVVTDDDPRLAHDMAEELGMAFYETRGQMSQWLDINAALDQVQERASMGERANKLVEWSDMAGSGFPTDGTELLRAMLERGMTDVAVGFLYDPLAVSISHHAGPGAKLKMRIGGKVSPYSGLPLDLDVVVERVYSKVNITSWGGGSTPCDAAVVRSGKAEILLVSNRFLGSGLQSFRDLGVEPDDKEFLLLKYLGGFETSELTSVFGSNFDHKTWPFRRITQPKYPWYDNPFTDISKLNC